LNLISKESLASRQLQPSFGAFCIDTSCLVTLNSEEYILEIGEFDNANNDYLEFNPF